MVKSRKAKDPGAKGKPTPSPHLLRTYVKILGTLTDGEIELLLPCFDLKEFAVGETVFSEGDEGQFVTFVVSGLFLVAKKVGHRGRQIILSTTGEGGTLGEFSIIGGANRTATVISIESGRLLLLERSRLDRFITDHPGIGCKILKGMIMAGAQRQAMTLERLLSLL